MHLRQVFGVFSHGNALIHNTVIASERVIREASPVIASQSEVLKWGYCQSLITPSQALEEHSIFTQADAYRNFDCQKRKLEAIDFFSWMSWRFLYCFLMRLFIRKVSDLNWFLYSVSWCNSLQLRVLVKGRATIKGLKPFSQYLCRFNGV